MIEFFLPDAPKMWHWGTHKIRSDPVNDKSLDKRSGTCRLTNGAFFAIRDSSNSSTYSGTGGQS